MQLYNQIKAILRNVFFLRKVSLHDQINLFEGKIIQSEDKIIQLEQKLGSTELELSALKNKVNNILNSLELIEVKKIIGLIESNSDQFKASFKDIDIILKYLFYESSESRSKLNNLLSSSEPLHLNRALLADHNPLNDPIFQQQCTDLICQNTKLNAAWFKGKKIFEAGCGIGRFSLGFLQLESFLIAVEQTQTGLEYTKNTCSKYADKSLFIHSSLLNLPNLDADFDLVWSYGMLQPHANAETYKMFQNIAQLVKPEGYIYIMIPSSLDWDLTPTFTNQKSLMKLNNLLSNEIDANDFSSIPDKMIQKSITLETSPSLNELYTHCEIDSWLTDAGFHNIRLVSDDRNHHITAQKT
ncbi:hypothetical protein BH10PSE19_BH10PSE19_04190 [soil metagenome]